MLTLLFDGIAYGMLLFVLAVGPGGDAGVDELHQPRARRVRDGRRLPDGAADEPARRAVPGLPAARVRRRRRRSARCSSARCTGRCTRKPHLDQVLFSIGLVFMAVAAVDYFVGSQQQIVQLPAWLRGRFDIAGGRHRQLPAVHHRRLRAADAAAAVGAVAHALRQPAARRGRRPARRRRPRASTSTASSSLTFAVGSGLAGLGGALGAEILGLDPTFPLKFMIYFLIVVTVGGTTHDHRAAAGRAAARHRRRRRQVLRAQARRLHRLPADDRDPDAAPAGAVRARQGRAQSEPTALAVTTLVPRRRRAACIAGAASLAAQRAGAGGSCCSVPS